MSTDPFAGFLLIRSDLNGLCKKLLEFPACNYWVHESVVSRFIGLPTNNQYGQSEALTALIACIKKSYGGNKRKKNQAFTGFNPIELQDENNESGVCFQHWGRKELFQRGTDSTVPLVRRPRWFKFGNGVIQEVGVQMDIVNQLVGNRVPDALNNDDPSIPVFAAKRRQKSHLKFYQGRDLECIPYRNYDVPAVAVKYLWMWPNIKLKSTTIRRRSFSPE
eukprot:CAMPEP_0196247260 /NCGR_PEP_ID=MMETSP0913-20130531/37723_1 /TAXON_ID=49265 /ORGANISM="Thalassiosira rotula, Strain GSO102" /LENGTH=219 /DNA_ID=CAMNT_0041532159 /DNA_START=276 /DNA_END=932 /DNA_ORIENTATION=-